MTSTALTCPSCGATAPSRIAMPSIGAVERYTCWQCNRTTLREELVPERTLRSWGGGGFGNPGIVLLATLRPAGALGDGSDLTFSNLTDSGFPATLDFPFENAVAGAFNGTIQRVDFYIRTSESPQSQGPGAATYRSQFRQGAGGTIRTAGSSVDTAFPNSGIVTYGPFIVTTDENGDPWIPAALSNLQLRVEALTDDLGSGVLTSVFVYEMYAQVYGSR